LQRQQHIAPVLSVSIQYPKCSPADLFFVFGYDACTYGLVSSFARYHNYVTLRLLLWRHFAATIPAIPFFFYALQHISVFSLDYWLMIPFDIRPYYTNHYCTTEPFHYLYFQPN
jgi:hypothetical protein